MAHRLNLNKSGFTIVELMIAISVFSVVIILASAALITVGRQYQFGVSKTKLLDASRELNQKIAQSIAYSGSTITPVSGLTGGYSGVCIGDSRYIWRQVPPNTNTSTGYLDTFRVQALGGSACSPGSINTNAGENPLPTNTAVTNFSILPNPLAGYDYKSQFVLADDPELLTGKIYNNGGTGNNVCIAQSVGGSYCAVVPMESTITRKVQ